jgi:hypothetical protein
MAALHLSGIRNSALAIYESDCGAKGLVEVANDWNGHRFENQVVTGSTGFSSEAESVTK